MSSSEEQKKAVVVVPVYKIELDEDETASFVHNADVLRNHDVVAIYPYGLDISFYKRIAPGVTYRAFQDDDFSNVARYNRLMTSSRFYKAFSDYEYLLICHFDAWVFTDELIEWCDQGYDYIGAPFMVPFVGKLSAAFPFLSKLYMNKIGNGGFCLRKISSHISITHRLRWLSPFCLVLMHEDIFYTLIVPLFFRGFRRPGAERANRFAVDKKPEECFKRLNGDLPFGCHGWFKRNREFWLGYIKPESNAER